MERRQSAPASGHAAARPGELTPGVAALLHGPDTAAKPARAPATEEPPPAFISRRWLQVTLLLTDVVLAALAVTLMLQSHGRFGALEVMLCVLALAIGALLSCWAFWLEV